MRTTVNPSLAIFLINRDVRGIMVAYDFYDADQKQPKDGKTYLFKSLDPSIKKGDLVVVPTSTRVGFTVCKVMDVNVEPEYDSTYDYKWIVSKVDRTQYDLIVEQEADAQRQIKEAEKLAARKELAEKLFASNKERLKALPLYKNGDSPSTEGGAGSTESTKQG